ncbi:MAG: glycosyltransferase family 39 protein [Bacteroidetes bacterium]|nr:glycosyltransferase family 39 protein [Bacteroidota bacterium]
MNNTKAFSFENGKFSFKWNEESISYLLLLLTLFIAYIIRGNFLEMPYERDEGAYSYYGKLLLEGKRPYVDFYEQKFPGIFYFYATVISIFGATVKGVHTGFMFVNLLTTVFLFIGVKKLFNSPMAAVATAITYAFVSMTPFLSGYTVQSEHGVNFFTSMGFMLYSFAKEHKKWWLYLLTGFAMGSAFMTKTTGVFLCAWGGLVIVSDYVFNKNRNFKTFFLNGLYYCIGMGVVVAFFFISILKKGLWADMMYWTITIPKQYVGKMPWEQGKQFLGYTYEAITKDYKFFWYTAYFGIFLCLVKTVDIKIKAAAVLFFICCAATVVPGYYFYGHYFIQVVPAIAVLTGFAFMSVTKILTERFNVKFKNIGYVITSAFVLFSLLHLSKNKEYYFHSYPESLLRKVYGTNPFPEAWEVGKFINENSKPEDKIVCIGSEPELYFYTGKNCPSRHAYFSALVNNQPQEKEWQKEFIKSVEDAKPRYFVFFNQQFSLLVQPGADQHIFQWAQKYTSENYKIVGIIEMNNGQMSNYLWKEAAQNYQPKSQEYVLVFERKG